MYWISVYSNICFLLYIVGTSAVVLYDKFLWSLSWIHYCYVLHATGYVFLFPLYCWPVKLVLFLFFLTGFSRNVLDGLKNLLIVFSFHPHVLYISVFFYVFLLGAMLITSECHIVLYLQKCLLGAVNLFSLYRSILMGNGCNFCW
jgi:hypothetical protein